MKKLTSITIILFWACNVLAQQGRVHQYVGKSVFWQNTPVAQYEVVFNFISKVDYSKVQSAQSLEIATQAIVTSGNQKFDAIIVTNTKYDIAIRFKDSTADKTLCVAEKVNNIPYFIDALPVDQYVIYKTKHMPRIIRNGKVFDLITSLQIATKLSLKPKASAIIIGDDNTHLWINFI